MEVVIALAIAAFGLGALMASASQGLRNVREADVYMEATRRAQGHLDAIGAADPPVAAERSGDDGGGFQWRVNVVPVASIAPPKGSNADGLTLYDVTVTISWRGTGTVRSVTVQSERFGRISKS
jgi:hypothetical protein